MVTDKGQTMLNKKCLLYYDTEIDNFGDMLNAVLIPQIFNYDIIECNKNNCEMIAIGSLLGRFLTKRFSLYSIFHRPVFVWGSGYVEFGQRKDMHYLIRKMYVYAIRGYLSLDKFYNVKGVKFAKDFAIGDPGLLSCKLIDTTKIKKKYDLGVVPHYTDKNSNLLKKIKVKNYKIIDIQTNPLKFLHDLSECHTVISSALHGIIASDSLGIPNIRMVCNNHIYGGDWKYNDYYSAFNIKEHDRIILSKQDFTENYLPKLKCMSQQKVDQICKNLIRTFPFI